MSSISEHLTIISESDHHQDSDAYASLARNLAGSLPMETAAQYHAAVMEWKIAVRNAEQTIRTLRASLRAAHRNDTAGTIWPEYRRAVRHANGAYLFRRAMKEQAQEAFARSRTAAQNTAA